LESRRRVADDGCYRCVEDVVDMRRYLLVLDTDLLDLDEKLNTSDH
jgi:hypothetical protein